MTTRAPRRDSVENRAGILDAARATLAVDPRASIDVIARNAGLSRRTLYGHFDDREALIRELISVGAQRFNAIAESVTDADPRLALARLAARLWQEAAHVQVAAALALDEAHVEHTAEALAPLRRTVAALAERGQSDGSFRTDLAASTLARLIEEVARTVVSRTDAASTGADNIAVRTLLSIAGLSWREADELLTAHSDIVTTQEVSA
ncbi:TetR/AcrR family transcriptional regulator [Microbacterium sp. CGR1]|uniref:TetR/AcrR family transcriptional regulator n=1 Tax=Microbacterium sp. CGR1 TaxID=1696072 RepID=UPI003DA40C0D